MQGIFLFITAADTATSYTHALTDPSGATFTPRRDISNPIRIGAFHH
jgi:hypothetical protein